MAEVGCDDPGDQLILHTLVVKGFCSEEAAAEATGLPLDEVVGGLGRLSGAGLATHRDGRVSGWSASPAARIHHRALVEGPLAAADRPAALAVYARFSQLNIRFKQVCTDWQVRTGAGGTMSPNDHSDAAYDAAVIGRLRVVHRAVSQLCQELEPGLPRVVRYEDRLRTALASIERGEHAQFTRPLCGSYHDVWMELHQDLIVTLGVVRTEDDA